MIDQPWIRWALRGVSKVEVAVSVVVAAIGQREVWAPGRGVAGHLAGPAAALALTYLLSSAALLWRRRAPLAVVAVVAVVLSVEFLVFGSSDGMAPLLPVLLAFYAAGRFGDPRRFPAALAITAAGVGIHEWRDSQFSFGARGVFMTWGVILASGLVGRFFNARVREVNEMSLRARRLEEEREERARAAVVAERSRIARELHDLVGHGISLMVLQLVAAQGNLDRGQIEPMRERLAQLESTARTTLGEMRRLVSVTDDHEPSLSSQPGMGDIAALVEEVRSSGVPVDLDMTGRAETPAGVGLAAYRVVQEALTNVIKHAPPGAGANVTVTIAADAVTVVVSDSGTGPVGDLRGGRGLAGMRERVALYGGTLQVGARPGGGFQVRACFPLESAPV